MRVWSVRHAAVPVVTFVLLLRRGSAMDPVGKEGLAALTADMLDEGSGDRSAIEMHEALARLGAQFDTDIGADAALATMTTLGRFADPGLRLLADMIARPDLTEADFQRVRQLRLHRLTQLRDVPSAVADRTFIKLVYGPHPYGHSPMGSESSLAAMTVDDVRAFHARAIRPGAATLIAVGDCDHATIERMAADAFAGWEGAAAMASSGLLWIPIAPRRSMRRGRAAPGSLSCRGLARRSRSCGSARWRSRATRPITTRSSWRTRFSAASSSAAST